jgi:hypothetical protein
MTLSSVAGVEIGQFLVAQEGWSGRSSQGDFARPLIGPDEIVIA